MKQIDDDVTVSFSVADAAAVDDVVAVVVAVAPSVAAADVRCGRLLR